MSRGYLFSELWKSASTETIKDFLPEQREVNHAAVIKGRTVRGESFVETFPALGYSRAICHEVWPVDLILYSTVPDGLKQIIHSSDVETE